MLSKIMLFCANIIFFNAAGAKFFADRAGERAHIEEPRKLTQISEKDLAKVLNESYYNVHRKLPDENTLASAWAHVALENNRGKRVWNYNLGNIGNSPHSRPAPVYDHFGKTKYRSYTTFVSAGEAYWRVISKCKQAVVNFRLGYPKAAAISLKRCNYYRANEEQYSTALSSLYAEGLRKLRK